MAAVGYMSPNELKMIKFVSGPLKRLGGINL